MQQVTEDPHGLEKTKDEGEPRSTDHWLERSYRILWQRPTSSWIRRIWGDCSVPEDLRQDVWLAQLQKSSRQGSEAPMRTTNVTQWSETITDAETYITGLTDKQAFYWWAADGWPVSLGSSFVSAALGMCSTMWLVGMTPQWGTCYKHSQDHIELFFSAVRAKGGFNNNPTALPFQEAAYKRLLTLLETALSEMRQRSWMCSVTVQLRMTRLYLVQIYQHHRKIQHDRYTNMHCGRWLFRNATNRSRLEYKEAPVAFHRRLCCNNMVEHTARGHWSQAMVNDKHSSCSSPEAGYNIHPPVWLRFVLKLRNVQFMLRSSDGHLPKCAGIIRATYSAALANLSGKPSFPTLDSQTVDTSVDDNHVHTLEKTTAECFTKLRWHHLGRCAAEMAVGIHVRKQFSNIFCLRTIPASSY